MSHTFLYAAQTQGLNTHQDIGSRSFLRFTDVPYIPLCCTTQSFISDHQRHIRISVLDFSVNHEPWDQLEGLGFGVWGLGFGFGVKPETSLGINLKVWGLGFGVWGLGFGVWVWGQT